jgi:hypothetical protein
MQYCVRTAIPRTRYRVLRTRYAYAYAIRGTVPYRDAAMRAVRTRFTCVRVQYCDTAVLRTTGPGFAPGFTAGSPGVLPGCGLPEFTAVPCLSSARFTWVHSNMILASDYTVHCTWGRSYAGA